MRDHDEIRELLPLAAAGLLDAADLRRLKIHLDECPACASEMRILEAATHGLRQMPLPTAPPWLAAKTCERVREAMAVQAENRWNERLVIFSLLLAWTLSLTLWFLYKVIAGGLPALVRPEFGQAAMYLAVSTFLVWLTAGVVVVAMGRRAVERRRLS